MLARRRWDPGQKKGPQPAIATLSAKTPTPRSAGALLSEHAAMRAGALDTSKRDRAHRRTSSTKNFPCSRRDIRRDLSTSVVLKRLGDELAQDRRHRCGVLAGRSGESAVAAFELEGEPADLAAQSRARRSHTSVLASARPSVSGQRRRERVNGAWLLSVVRTVVRRPAPLMIAIVGRAIARHDCLPSAPVGGGCADRTTIPGYWGTARRVPVAEVLSIDTNRRAGHARL